MFSTCIFSFFFSQNHHRKSLFFLVSFLYRHQKAPSVSTSASVLATKLSFFFIPEMIEVSGSLQGPERAPCPCDFSFTLQILSITFHGQKSCCPSSLPSCSFLQLFLPKEINSNPTPVLCIFLSISFCQTGKTHD